MSIRIPYRMIVAGALLPALAAAQSGRLSKDSAYVWMECLADDGHTLLEAWCENLSRQERELTYELRLERQDKNGNISSSVQGGGFILRGKELKLLCTFSVNRTETDFFMAHLRVYEGARLVASAYQSEGQRFFEGLPPNAREKVASSQREESGGSDVLVIDQARTRAGREFYSSFYNAWQAPPAAEDYVIRIEELPFRGIATWIKIFIDEEQAFEYALQPQSRYIEELAQIAVVAITREVEQRELTKKSLEREDKMGSGLF